MILPVHPPYDHDHHHDDQNVRALHHVIPSPIAGRALGDSTHLAAILHYFHHHHRRHRCHLHPLHRHRLCQHPLHGEEKLQQK